VILAWLSCEYVQLQALRDHESTENLIELLRREWTRVRQPLDFLSDFLELCVSEM